MAKQPVVFELFYDDAWHATDNPPYTRDPINITRGRGNERGRVRPGSCPLTLDNRTGPGNLNPRIPTSPLYGKIGRNTPARVRYPTPVMDVSDSFTRTVSNAWGFATSGQGYGLAWLGGSVNDFDVAAGVGTMVVSGAVQYRLAYMPAPSVSASNVDVVVTGILPTNNVTGGSLEPINVAVRLLSTTSYYLFRVEYTTGEALRTQIFAPGGGLLVDTLAFLAAGWTPGENIKVRAVADGGTFKMRVWPASVAEPNTWHATAEDYTYLGPGGVGLRAGAAAGNTNVPVTFGFDDFTVTTSDTLMSGEVPEWSPRWAGSDSNPDVYTPIEVSGILRRLNQGAKALQSPMYRAYAASNPTAWWPLEDGDGADNAASGVAGVEPMQYTEAGRGLVRFGAAGPAGASSALDTARSALVGDVLTAAVPVVAGATSWRAEWSAMYQTTDINYTLNMPGWTTTGGVLSWFVQQTPGFGLQLMYVDGGGAFEAAATLTERNDGQYHLYTVTATQNGANIDVTLAVDGVTVDTGTVAAHAFGVPTSAGAQVSLFPLSSDSPVAAGLSHFAFWVPTSAAVTFPAFQGHAGESAAERIDRLCFEHGVAFSLTGSASDTARVGVQQRDTLPNLLQHAADADLGVLYELRSALGLGYRTRTSLYSQAPLELTYQHIAPPLLPVDDDQITHNDVTVTRPLGGVARAVQLTGPLSTQDPPNGVGTYDRGPVEAQTYTDAQLTQIAHWIRSLGTRDEARYPSITLDLAAPIWEADPRLTLAALRLDTGDVLSIDGLPVYVSYDAIGAMVQSCYTLIESHKAKITITATPAGPWEVGILNDSSHGRLGTAGSTTTEALDTTETGVDVLSVGAPWSPTAVPYDIVIGGERMTVGSVSGGVAAAQTLNVTRSVNGVVKTHASGAQVQLFKTFRLAL